MRATGSIVSIPERDVVLANTSITGNMLCLALSNATDSWLRRVYAEAVVDVKHTDDLALVAVGGYGRRELAPYSDLDVVLIHRNVKNVDEIAAKMWYPIWDAKLKLGHAVRTPKETVQLCANDLDTATSLLTARHLAGNMELAVEVIESVRTSWKQRGRQWLVELHQRVLERHAAAGEVAFLLEPNLKEGLGGLRDIHALWWAIAAGLDLARGDRQALVDGNQVLLSARVELHRHSGRGGDVLRLEDQAAVATAIGYSSDDALMADLASVGRRIAWIADEAWSRLDPPRGATDTPQPVATGIDLVMGEIVVNREIDPADDPTLLVRVATAAARRRTRIARDSLNHLADRTPTWPSPWPAGASDELVALLLEGEAAIAVLEALDQRNLLVKVLPEWAPVRSKPQRNAYHRFTVDRHLWQTVANAAALRDRVSRPDLLVLGALFHDIGKGYPGEHSEVGVELFDVVGKRMGLPSDDIETVQTLIAHHLLLADVATHRDLSDDATITMVAAKVGSRTTLALLHALTEADSLATGPSAWSDWKADLVNMLVSRVDHVLGGGDIKDVMWRLFPDAEVLQMMATGDTAFRCSNDAIAIVSPDRPGTFSRVAGVLALHNLDVLGAEAHSDEGVASGVAMAASEFRVAVPSHGPIDWTPITDNLRRALNGELALEARLAERAKTSRARRVLTAHPPAAPRVRIDNDASSNATFIEVKAPDRVGILYRITKVLADIGLDIRHARVQTVGNEVVDSFYVRTVAGQKVSSQDHRGEIERALLFALGE